MKVLLLLNLVALALSAGSDDLVKNLPGLTFQKNFDVYSGYLKANEQGNWKMHYVLMESQNNKDTDPLLLWFNGGPGCSSLGGLFSELGPFYVNYDGQTLFENPYAWNKKANVLAMESPIGVGFSYNTEVANFTNASDDQTAQQNYLALVDFFKNVQPQYVNRTFFLSGESYAGIYIPMLSSLIVEGINKGDFPNKNFQGAAIGNGFMHVPYLMNSLVIWNAYHGVISQDKWDLAKQKCQTGKETDHDKYDYTQFMTTTNGMDYTVTDSECGKLIAPLISDRPGGQNISFDAYNFYQDCYKLGVSKTKTGIKLNFGDYTNLGQQNTANLFNYDSTDTLLGYPCWNDDAIAKYLNRADVQAAMNIDDKWKGMYNGSNQWRDCNDPIYDLYNLTYNDMGPFFDSVLTNNKVNNFRFLIYNGDVDTVCNYLGDSWFIRDVTASNKLVSSGRYAWLFGSQLAGFHEHYSGQTPAGNVTIDVLTVKGAGHFVPTDRPGPSLQMITNFMYSESDGTVNFNSTANVDSKAIFSPLNPTSSGVREFSLFFIAVALLLNL